MDVPTAIRQLEKFQRVRPKARSAPAIAMLVKKTATTAARTHRRLGRFIELWEKHVPAELAEHAVITGHRAGVAQVTVDSSAVAYELDRQLRTSLLQAMRAEYTGTLHRVKIRVGALDA